MKPRLFWEQPNTLELHGFATLVAPNFPRLPHKVMKFGLGKFFGFITTGIVLLWANLRVSPEITKYELYPGPVGCREFFEMRGWPLSPWWFGTYGPDGLKESLSFSEFYGVWLFNVVLAAVICLSVSYFLDSRCRKKNVIN
jgi:hypothetical protein